MILRQGMFRGMESEAEFSDDLQHRFRLTRRLGDGPNLCFIMLNPSGATEVQTDNTVSFCTNRARDWGFGQITVVNLFTFMTPHPNLLAGHAGRDDALNDAVIRQAAEAAHCRIAAWGGDRRFRERAAHVAALLADNRLALHCLLRTRDGDPSHPRGKRADVRPISWP